VTMTGNSLRLAGKILVLVKLTIYAKAGRLRPRTNMILTSLQSAHDKCQA